jgi:hypothetical protein
MLDLPRGKAICSLKVLYPVIACVEGFRGEELEASMGEVGPHDSEGTCRRSTVIGRSNIAMVFQRLVFRGSVGMKLSAGSQ